MKYKYGEISKGKKTTKRKLTVGVKSCFLSEHSSFNT